MFFSSLFFFNDTATTEIYTLSLHDALPICRVGTCRLVHARRRAIEISRHSDRAVREARRRSGSPARCRRDFRRGRDKDRKSTRLNSSHANISYAVFCLKKKKKRIKW